MRLRLIYFPVRAKAECLRMAMLFAGVQFEDNSPMDFFGKGWKDGAKAETPFGQLPLLAVDDAPPLAQSGAIMRYISRVLAPDLTPKDPMLAAQCDALYEASQELATAPTNVNPIVNVFRGDDFKEKKATYFSLAPAKIANLAKALGDGPFFLGSTPYYCDFSLYHVLDNTRTLEPTALDEHPNLLAFMKSVEALPAIKDYLDERPDAIGIGTEPKLVPKEKLSKKPRV